MTKKLLDITIAAGARRRKLATAVAVGLLVLLPLSRRRQR
jgi:hypothetical protein